MSPTRAVAQMAIRSAAVRDALILVGVFAVLLGGLYAYTGTWPPAVIVESGSMMHLECGETPSPNCDPDVKYGRFGTIDPGDLVLVKDVEGVDEVGTLVEGGKERYGRAGDVIVYYPANDRTRTPIIHRAVAYVEVREDAGEREFWVRWNPDAPCEPWDGVRKSEDGRWCVYDSRGVYIPSVPIAGFGSTLRDPNPYKPVRSGFITKGDNPTTNPQTDQVTQLSRDEQGNPSPVQIEWVEGKGRAELPWLGLIKLSLSGQPNERNPPAAWVKVGSAYAPKDLWVMLGVSLFLLVGVPLLYDGYKAFKTRRDRKLEEQRAAAQLPAPDAPTAPVGGPEPPPPGSP